jgi:GNAT superfamily N-acetyltransferase
MQREPVLLEAFELDRAGALLARSFHDDPLLVHVLPDSDDRARRTPAYFTTLLRLTHAVGEVYRLAPGFEAVAAWHRSSTPHEMPEHTTTGFDDLPAQLGEEAFAQVLTAVRFIERFHEEAAQRLHWFLQFIGVEPGQQGRGLGTALLQPLLVKADSEGLECYLWTLLKRNLAFYSKHDFAVVVEEIEPSSGLRFWGLLRSPGERLSDSAIRSQARRTER